MSLILVPLAGPDFYSEQFGVRPLYPYRGGALIEQVLARRSWMKLDQSEGNRLVFILREEASHTATLRAFLARLYPKALFVVLSSLTGGALLSALAGAAYSQDSASPEPVIVDLADIDFAWDFDSADFFAKNEQADAAVPYFTSRHPKFSYLRLAPGSSCVLETREKECISEHASAGVYIFRNAATVLRAVLYGLENPEACRVGSSLFICPSLNGLIKRGREVVAFAVQDVTSMSTLFSDE